MQILEQMSHCLLKFLCLLYVLFNNYDSFVETLDGANTLYYIAPIKSRFSIDLDISNSNNCQVSDMDINLENVDAWRRRRSYNTSTLDIAPYSKRPDLNNSELLPYMDMCESVKPQSVEKTKRDYFLWLFDH